MSLGTALLLALAAGLSIPLGAMVSTHARLGSICRRHELDSFVSYFGGGALMAAVALVLVPYGMERASVWASAAAFLTGGLVFWQIDRWTRRAGGAASNFTGMLLDFIPEAIALGAAAVAGVGSPMLLALLIALQNMPEGFASQHEMQEGGVPARRAWMMLGLAPLAGPIAAWGGYSLLAEAEEPLAWLMLWCSGGILYLIFQDIAPQARLRHHDFPAIGAVSGFLLGMVGVILLH